MHIFLLLALFVLTPVFAEPPELPDNCYDATTVDTLLADDAGVNCNIQGIKKQVVPGVLGEQYWYVSDGHCVVRAEKALEAYEKARNWLLTPSNYAQKNGGLDQVLEFLVTDKKLGKEDAFQGLRKDHDPFYSLIGLKGVGLPFFSLAFYYFVKNEPLESKAEGLSEFVLPYSTHIENHPLPEKFKKTPPSLYWIEGDKKKFASKPRALDHVLGKWCLRETKDAVIVRYFTAADMQIDFKAGALTLVKRMAEQIHRETLETLAGVARD